MFEPRSIVAATPPDDRPRVLLACDRRLTQDLLVMLLAADGGFQTAAAQGLDGALAAVARDGPFDIVLLDADPGTADEHAVSRLVAANAGLPVAMICDRIAPRRAAALIGAGLAGLLLHSMPARGLPHALRLIYAGERYLPSGLLGAGAAPVPLSDRQRLVLGGLADGRPNKTIARDLGLAEPTVKMHVTAICRKLGASNRTQAALIARDRGLVASV